MKNNRNLFLAGVLWTTIVAASFLGSSIMMNSRVMAQNIPDDGEIIKYAQAILAMEPSRQIALGEIKKLLGNDEMPMISCHDNNSMTNLPRRVQDIAVNYCNRSQEIVKKYISIERFNNITLQIQSNNNLRREVHNMLIRLQNTPASR